MYKEEQIIKAFKHLKTKGEGDRKEQSFITEWLNDSNIQIRHNLTFDPYNGVRTEDKNKDDFNLFGGYNPLIKTIYNTVNTVDFCVTC
jgi:hypothetical protein